MANEVRIEARPWEPQDLIDDLQLMIDEEPDNYLNANRATLCMARDYLKKFFAEESLRPKGKWRLNKDGSGTCSECHRTRNDVWDMDNWDNFCSHCGADMRGELTKENEARLIERIKRFWERHFKPRCPDCGGVMDGDQFDMELDKVVYACRICNKEWV